MKFVISGGTGLIGSKLTRDLSWDGHDVSVLSRSPQHAPDFPDRVNLVKWDAKNVGEWVDILEGSSAVINLAGESIAGKGFFPSPWTNERREKIPQSRINVGHTLTQGIQAISDKPNVLIQASAIGYYGTHGDEIVMENNPSGSDFVAKTCIEWEKSTSEVTDLGVRRVVTRFGLVLSTKGGALPRLHLPFKFCAGGPMGDGEQWYSWIHIDDVCDAIRYLIHHSNTEGVYNLTAPHPVKNKTFANILGKVTASPSFLPIPGFLMRWAFGDVATVVLDGQRVIPQRLKDLDFTFQFPTLEMALRDLLTRP